MSVARLRDLMHYLRMMNGKRYLVAISVLFFGAGCGSPDALPQNDPASLNMPGVPYGTYKQAQEDIRKADHAEQQRGVITQ